VRQWAGVVAGALVIAIPLALAVVIAPRFGVLFSDGTSLNVLFLVCGLAGGFGAGVLSAGGSRAGIGSALLSAVLGLGAIALYFVLQASTVTTGDGVPTGLWPIAIMILGMWVLPSAVLGGALAGSLRRPFGPPEVSLEPES